MIIYYTCPTNGLGDKDDPAKGYIKAADVKWVERRIFYSVGEAVVSLAVDESELSRINTLRANVSVRELTKEALATVDYPGFNVTEFTKEQVK
jgi:hypothetical protein